MNMHIGRATCAVALATAVAVCCGEGRADTVSPDNPKVVDGGGNSALCSLDLTAIWEKTDVNPEQIEWSSLGWGDAAEEPNGKTVTLELVPIRMGSTITLMEPSVGFRQKFIWTPQGMSKQVYRLRHIVKSDSSPVFMETLNAYFSFENYEDVAPSDEDVKLAIYPDGGEGWNYTFANDAQNWWALNPNDGGIMARSGTSSFSFTVSGEGTFGFNYAMGDATWTVSVDGGVAQALSSSVDWTALSLVIDGLTTHTVVFSTTLSEEGAFARLRNVSWTDKDWRSDAGSSGMAKVDLREGALVIRRSNELLPLTYSPTNFTGDVLGKDVGYFRIDEDSVVSVRVVQMTGDAGVDVSEWTTEVQGTSLVLKDDVTDEGVVQWDHVNAGVWKAELTIKTDGESVHRETRIFNLRHNIGFGTLIFVK